MQLKGHCFDTVAKIQSKQQKVLDSLMENDFQVRFKKWQERWDWCIAEQRKYFEGDDVNTYINFF